MNKRLEKVLARLTGIVLMVFCAVAIAATEMDEAVKRYYAGYPYEAISILKPLARSGDADAQYLLGNMLYSLSKVKKLNITEDPVKWYKMSAQQNSAPANYALGVTFYNSWLESRNKKEAASAIIYYQKALDLGYGEAREPLKKLKSSSGLSYRQAAALTKELQKKPVPQPKPDVQKYSIPIVKPTLIVDQEPVVKSAVMVNSGPVTKPDPITKAGLIAKSDPVNKPDPIVDHEPVEKPAVMAKSEPVVKRGSDTMPGLIAKPDPVNKPVPVTRPEKTQPEDSKPLAPIANERNDRPAMTVTLAEVASQCQNFTQSGFNLYAQTIKDALFSGTAVLVSKKSEYSKPGTYLVNLTSHQADIAIELNLHAVPQGIASGLEKGDKLRVTGVVIDSRAVGSVCTLNIKYQPVKF